MNPTTPVGTPQDAALAARGDIPPWSLDLAECVSWLAGLPLGGAQAAITDPPYGVAYRSKNRALSRRTVEGDGAGAPFIWFLHALHRALAPGSPVVCFCRWDVAEPFRLGLVWAGFTIRSQIVWDKQRHGPGDTRASLAPSHEQAWLATKGAWSLPGGRPRDVFQCKKVDYRRAIHPTEKPVGLLRELVRAVTRPGDLVLDPFAGSGSTAEACLLEGRTFRGCEIDAAHHAAAAARLRAFNPSPAAASAVGEAALGGGSSDDS